MLDTKNITNLLIKVYEITTENYYRKHKKSLSTDINLDGLVPTEEFTKNFNDAPIVRKLRLITFPNLTKKV